MTDEQTIKSFLQISALLEDVRDLVIERDRQNIFQHDIEKMFRTKAR